MSDTPETIEGEIVGESELATVPAAAIDPGVIAKLADAVSDLALDAPHDDVALVMCLRDRAKEAVAQLNDRLDGFLVDWIQRNGEIEIGTCRWYVGPDKTYKPREAPHMLADLLELFTGDMVTVCEFLSASAWKHGSIRKRLEEAGKAEAFDRLFETVVRDEVREGKVKRPKKIDVRYIR